MTNALFTLYNNCHTTQVIQQMEKLRLFPLTATINNAGHMEIGGCDCVDLISKFGSPLYVFDDYTIRTKCRIFIKEFTARYANSSIIYASKAFLNKSIANIIKNEGLGLDIVSGGELALAKSVSFPHNKIYFHGNNKTERELKEALNYRVGYVVADNFHELTLLHELLLNSNIKQKILLRISPGIDAHTHQYTTTGILDSKFGFPISTGQAEDAIKLALSSANMDLIGLHFHLGSPIFDIKPFKTAIELVIDFAQNMHNKYDFKLNELSVGGGFAVQYTMDQPAPEISEYAEVITACLTESLKTKGLPDLKLIVEPGRAIIAQAGIALYTVGAKKEIPDIRNYIFIDGGMGDNIRPALYQSRYEAIVADKANLEENSIITIAGKYCESGDILIRDTKIAPVEHGNFIAIPVAGAYAPSMSCNYNMIPRPAIVMVQNGKTRIIRKRESYQDLLRLDC